LQTNANWFAPCWLADNPLDLDRLGCRKGGTQVQVPQGDAFGRPRERFLEHTGGGGEIAGGIDDRVAQVRALLNRRGVGGIRVRFGVAGGEDRKRADRVLDPRTIRVVDTVEEGVNRCADRKGRPRLAEGMALRPHRNRRWCDNGHGDESDHQYEPEQNDAHNDPCAPLHGSALSGEFRTAPRCSIYLYILFDGARTSVSP